jgi:hypothetical protein
MIFHLFSPENMTDWRPSRNDIDNDKPAIHVGCRIQVLLSREIMLAEVGSWHGVMRASEAAFAHMSLLHGVSYQMPNATEESSI